MAAGDCCGNCKFFRVRQIENGQRVGICIRNGPTVHAQFFLMEVADNSAPKGVRQQPVDVSKTYWPSVEPTELCGEYAAAIAIAPGSALKS